MDRHTDCSFAAERNPDGARWYCGCGKKGRWSRPDSHVGAHWLVHRRRRAYSIGVEEYRRSLRLDNTAQSR